MRSRRIRIGLTAVALLASLAACGGGTPGAGQTSQSNTNPRTGWVDVDPAREHGTVVKRCDGPTLIYVSKDYYSGGISTIPDSPECKTK